MPEKQEILLTKLILSNCDENYKILDIFRLIKEIDTFYKINIKR